MTEEKDKKGKFTQDIEKLEQELEQFQKEWDEAKKKGLKDIEKIEQKIENDKKK